MSTFSALTKRLPVLADPRGSTAVLFAVGLSGILGVAGLATEAGAWYLTKRSMQGAADAAAYAAATLRTAGGSSTQLTTEAKSIAARYSFVDGTAGATVSVNNPPSSGDFQTNSGAVEVVISQPQTPLLSGLFMSTGPTITVRSVALANLSGTGCVLALDRGKVTDVTDQGNTTINLNGCSIFVNSNSGSALTMSGGAVINAKSAYIVGGESITNNSHLNTTNGTYTGVQPISDPYASVQIPSYSGCDQNNFKLTSGSNQVISPSGTYVFCNGLTLVGGSSLTLNPGTYVIDRGTLSIAGNATLSATGGVTIVLTSSTGSNYATASIASNANVSITAPTSGALAGLALFQDRNAPSDGSNSLTGGATQNIVGAIYFPDQTVTFAGGSSTGSAQCTQLIAYILSFSGNSNFNTNCTATGTQTIGLPGGQLVE